MSPSAVKIKKTLKNLNVVETQEAVFSLELTHENVRGVQWIKNGVEIQPSEKFEISMEGMVHTLKINNCSTHDESVYSFKLGKLSASARLNVESKKDVRLAVFGLRKMSKSFLILFPQPLRFLRSQRM